MRDPLSGVSGSREFFHHGLGRVSVREKIDYACLSRHLFRIGPTVRRGHGCGRSGGAAGKCRPFIFAEVWCHTVLVWIGFGTLAGLVARAMMPGRDPGGAVATLLMGVGGSVIGCGTLTYLSHGVHVSPISPIGFVVATGGAFVLLAFYKLFSGRIIREDGDGPMRVIEETRPSYRRRRGGSRHTILEE
jgi:uncharacterized membrane protein YeaQ/YmgE (transglycosylase-associated protein family)